VYCGIVVLVDDVGVGGEDEVDVFVFVDCEIVVDGVWVV